VGPQGLGEAEMEEAVLGQHVSQKLRGLLAQVALPKEIILWGRRRPKSTPIPTHVGTPPQQGHCLGP
jgi:hypothetical protein